MKRKFTILIAAIAAILMMAQPKMAVGQSRTEAVVYTLDGTETGSGSTYDDGHNTTQSNITWTVTGNITMNPWRLGGKSLTNVDRPIYSTSAITSNSTNITKVVVTTGTTNLTVNSVKLIVADNANFTNATTLTEDWVASSPITFNRPNNANWTDQYFKIVYNLTTSSTSNKYAQFVKAEFYAETGGGSTVDTPEIKGETPFLTSTSVSITCGTTGASIQYSLDNGTNWSDYTSSFTITETTTVKAKATKTGMTASAEACGCGPRLRMAACSTAL